MPFSDDDDFILTISDEDALPSPPPSDTSHASPPLQRSPPPSKKRKYQNTNGKSAHPQAGSKKQKIQNSNIEAEVEAQEDEDEERIDWTSGGQDDGAMDSDFEFEVHANEALTEDIDEWGFEDKKKELEKGNSAKKGVDIEDLIARRKEKKGATNGGLMGGDGAVKETRIAVEDGGDEIEEDDVDAEAVDVEEEGERGDEAEDEDETLADDAFGMGVNINEIESDENDDTSADELASDSGSEAVGDEMPEPSDAGDDSSEKEEINSAEQARRDAFFAPEDTNKTSQTINNNSFQTFNLSRPILKGLTSAGFTKPTPIQSRSIPIALMGKDVVGGAVTGSGKTAAFVIPIIERLLYRPKKLPTSRVAVLTPTRELASQCFKVAKKLASFTDITFCELVGGFSLREQESVLRTRPDVIIATPGRFIDHMRNSPSFAVDTLEILVLDEADRMLEEGFADELNEILTTIPKSRQTMLFSATMTNSVDQLIRVGLKKPVRLMVDSKKQTVGTLTQEFVRLRPGKEGLRLGYLAYLCHEIFTDRVIVFFRQKKEVHRVRILFALLGIKAAELHGSMSQEQRTNAIYSFTSHNSTHLLATDLASRGLDIPSVSTVINYSAPQTHEIYVHRVGRTARAGRSGRSCTLAAEEDRKIIKSVVRTAKAQGAKIVSRTIPPSDGDAWAKKVEEMEDEVSEVLKEEKEEKLMQAQEMMVRKGENLIEHEEEIHGREKRTWFVSEKEKSEARKRGFEALNGVRKEKEGKGKGKGKLSGKEKKRRDDRRERGEGRMWKKGKGDSGGGGGLKTVKGRKGAVRLDKKGEKKRKGGKR